MGNPITWQNVTGPSQADAARMMDMARSSLNVGFDAFGKVIKDTETFNANQVLKLDEAAKQNYLDRVQQMRTAEEVAVFEASPEAEGMRQKMQAPTRGLVRPAAEARGQYLTGVQRGTDRFGWDRNVEARAGDANTRAQQTAAEAALMAPLTRAATTAATNASNQQVAVGTQSIARSKQEILESGQRIDASKLLETRLTAEANNKEFERRGTQYAATVAKLGANTKETIGNNEGFDSLTDSLSKVIKDPKALTDAISFVTTSLKSNPAFARLPTDVVKNLVLSKADEYGRWNGNTDSTLIKYLTTGMTEALTTSNARMVEHETKRGALVELSQRQLLQLHSAESLAYPELQKALEGRVPASEKPTTQAPAPAAPASAPAAAANNKNVLLDSLAELERAEIAAGVRKETSPEVTRHISNQTGRDRESIRTANAAGLGGAVALGNAFNDLVTLPARGLMGAANTVLRVPNAFGAKIPYFSGTYVDSMTPYSDLQRLKDGGEFTKEELAAKRKELEAKLADARNK